MVKLFRAILVWSLLLSCCVRVSAATGVITVTAPAGGELTLYRVGIRSSEDQVLLTEEFAAADISVSQLHSPEAARLLAAFACEKNLPGIVKSVDENGTACFDDLPEGVYLMVQTKQSEGFMPISPFLFSIPEADHYAVEAKPKQQTEPSQTQPESSTPQTGDTVKPLLLPAAAVAVFSGIGLLLCIWLRKNRRP